MPHLNMIAQSNPYYRFGSPSKLAKGIMGVKHPIGKNGICITVIMSEVEGRGEVGRYINRLKETFNVVKFPNVMSERLEGMLKRRGFHMKYEYVQELKAHVDCYVWRKKNLPKASESTESPKPKKGEST